MTGPNGEFALPVGTVTLLLADIEGSTRLWEERGGEMADALARLDAVVDDVVGQHEGVLPLEQGEGDSFVAAFARGSAAVACALNLQADLADGPIALRVGLHTGEVTLRDAGNYIGPAINRCARLRDVAHGGQVLLSQTTADLVQDRLPVEASLRDMGSHRLLDLGRPEHLYQLCHPSLTADFAPLRSLDALPHNLPVELTSFVGRRAELAEVTALLGLTRLLTLTGSGGCGKTRLALQVGASVVERYPDGVWLVELAPVDNPALVARAIAEALPLRAGIVDVESLAAATADKRLVVILDNCEHLVRPVAELADHLLRHTRSVSIVATSREPLGVAGEVTWRVPSLSFPVAGEPTPIDALGHYEAVQLFLDRARRARPGFVLTESNAAAVAEICHRLDGIPLAIELAAARVRVLPPAQISDGLHDRFRLLTGGARTAVPRQQTLEASVEWSFDLLMDTERALLRRLSVFAGGFTLEAAEAVGAADRIETHHILDLLSQLVDKSLVAVEERDDGADGRFGLLETVRYYAARRLRDAGEAPDAQRRHFDCFSAFARRRPYEAEDNYRRRLRADYDNLRRALAWAAEQEDPELLLGLVLQLHVFWAGSSHLVDACAWLRIAIDQAPRADPSVRATALGNLARLAALAEDMPAAAAAATEALSILRERNDTPALVAVLTTRCQIGELFGEPDAGRYADEAAFLAEELGDRSGLALALVVRAGVGQYRPAERTAARLTLGRSIEVARECGAQLFELIALGALGCMDALDCEPRTAIKRFAQVLPGLREMGDGFLLSLFLMNLVHCLVMVGEFEEATAVCAELADLEERVGSAQLWFSADAGGRVAFGQGDWERSIRRYRDQLLTFTAVPFQGLRAGYLAWSELLGGDPKAAGQHLDQFLADADAASVSLGLPLAVRALVAREDGDLAEADDLAWRALNASPNDPNPQLTTSTALGVLAAIKSDLADHEVATRLWAAEDAFAGRVGMVRHPAVEAHRGPSLAACHTALGDPAFDDLWAEGATMSLADAAAYATRGRGERRRPPLGWASLTPTEHEVVKLVADGLSNPDIAARLFVSRRTVTTHLTNVFRKLGLSSRGELTAEAVRQTGTSPITAPSGD